jgi:fumarylpyruvate hydrolase
VHWCRRSPARSLAPRRAQHIAHPSSAAITLTVNGQPRQSSVSSKLIWSVAECVAYLSDYETLEPGDIIMTGTPEGVNAVVEGDVMRGEVRGLGSIEVRVAG